MRSRVRLWLAIAATLLGVVHCVYGLAAFKTVTLQLIWFLGAGVAMIVTGISNLSAQTTAAWPRIIQNALMCAYIILIAYLAPEPQVLLGLALFTGLLILSALPRPS